MHVHMPGEDYWGLNGNFWPASKLYRFIGNKAPNTNLYGPGTGFYIMQPANVWPVSITGPTKAWPQGQQQGEEGDIEGGN